MSGKSLNPKNYTLLPNSDEPDKMPSDGFLQDLSTFCKRSFDQKCIDHYKKTNVGFSTCPRGFATYGFNVNNRRLVWTGIKVKGYSDLAAIRARESAGGFKLYLPDEVQALADKNIELMNKLNASFDSKINKEQATLNEAKQHTLNAFHEIRPLNAEVKAAVSKLKSALGTYRTKIIKDYENIQGQLLAISTSADIISARMEQRDFLVNPSLKLLEKPHKINIRQEVVGIHHMFKSSLKKEKMNMVIKIPGTAEVRINKLFKMILFVIIENAFKYSPANTEQSIEVSEKKVNEHFFQICISSVGPIINSDEVDKIFEPFFRGAEAKDVDGTGMGLHVAKVIADTLGLKIAVDQSDSGFNFNKKEYVNTKFLIQIPNAFLC